MYMYIWINNYVFDNITLHKVILMLSWVQAIEPFWFCSSVCGVQTERFLEKKSLTSKFERKNSILFKLIWYMFI